MSPTSDTQSTDLYPSLPRDVTTGLFLPNDDRLPSPKGRHEPLLLQSLSVNSCNLRTPVQDICRNLVTFILLTVQDTCRNFVTFILLTVVQDTCRNLFTFILLTDTFNCVCPFCLRLFRSLDLRIPSPEKEDIFGSVPEYRGVDPLVNSTSSNLFLLISSSTGSESSLDDLGLRPLILTPTVTSLTYV